MTKTSSTPVKSASEGDAHPAILVDLPRNPERELVLEPIRALLLDASSVLSIAHPFGDGDALGSQLALHYFAQSLGKRSVMLNFDPLPATLRWPKGVSEMTDHLADDDQFDLIFLMETTEASRMGDRTVFFKRARTAIHLDHHVDVKGLGDRNLLDPKASSVCELLFDLLAYTGHPLPADTIKALYIGIMTDTGNFRFPSTTRRCHEIAGWMIDHGVEHARLFKRVYEVNSYSRILLHGAVMSRAQRCHDGKIAHSSLALDDFARLGATPVDADGAVNQLVSIVGVEAAVLFREVEGGAVKASFRSSGHVDVQEVAKKLGGGGHRLAASATVPGPLIDSERQVLATLGEHVARAFSGAEACDA
ncbi:MAG: bifunctional oligoribonuclease/PAP phosphatase NrnA [Candidatus Ozemobacteraceae bacterium]